MIKERITKFFDKVRTAFFGVGDPLRRERRLGTLYSAPMAVWFIIFFVVPIVIIVLYSFLQRGLHGGVVWNFSLDAYLRMFDKTFGKILLRTIWISAASTLGCLILAIPTGYAMARSRKYQTFLLFLVMIPFWTNSLIRIFAWISLLSSEGLISQILQALGFATDNLKLIYTPGAVIMVLIYMHLPFAILPLFTTMDKFEFTLLDAARDLGATKFQAIRKVMFPNIRSGVLTAIIFTFIPIFGAYTVPQLIGGKDSTMIGTIIYDQVIRQRDWPLASAFSVILTLISTIGVLWMMASNKKGQREISPATSNQATIEKNVITHQQSVAETVETEETR